MEIGCPACGRTLKLADEHAGKQIRCPACQQVSLAPGVATLTHAESDGSPGAPALAATKWHLRMPEGPIYGPVDLPEVLAWATEGRIVDDCELAESRSGPWRKAADVLPQVSVLAAPDAGVALPAGYPWHAAGQRNMAAPGNSGGGYVAPHRGGLILLLGLISWIGCPLVSFAAWIMGSHDLREMRAGRMDKSGESPTLAGMIFGMIVSLLWLLACGVAAVVLLVVTLLR